MSSFPFEQRRPFYYQSMQQEPPKKHTPNKHPPKHGYYQPNFEINPRLGTDAVISKDHRTPAMYYINGDFMTISGTLELSLPAEGSVFGLIMDIPPGYKTDIIQDGLLDPLKSYSFIMQGSNTYGTVLFDGGTSPSTLMLVINTTQGLKFEKVMELGKLSNQYDTLQYTLTIPVTHASH
jgi:hypothetical protein